MRLKGLLCILLMTVAMGRADEWSWGAEDKAIEEEDQSVEISSDLDESQLSARSLGTGSLPLEPHSSLPEEVHDEGDGVVRFEDEVGEGVVRFEDDEVKKYDEGHEGEGVQGRVVLSEGVAAEGGDREGRFIDLGLGEKLCSYGIGLNCAKKPPKSHYGKPTRPYPIPVASYGPVKPPTVAYGTPTNAYSSQKAHTVAYGTSSNSYASSSNSYGSHKVTTGPYGSVKAPTGPYSVPTNAYGSVKPPTGPYGAPTGPYRNRKQGTASPIQGILSMFGFGENDGPNSRPTQPNSKFPARPTHFPAQNPHFPPTHAQNAPKFDQVYRPQTLTETYIKTHTHTVPVAYTRTQTRTQTIPYAYTETRTVPVPYTETRTVPVAYTQTVPVAHVEVKTHTVSPSVVEHHTHTHTHVYPNTHTGNTYTGDTHTHLREDKTDSHTQKFSGSQTSFVHTNFGQKNLHGNVHASFGKTITGSNTNTDSNTHRDFNANIGSNTHTNLNVHGNAHGFKPGDLEVGGFAPMAKNINENLHTSQNPHGNVHTAPSVQTNAFTGQSAHGNTFTGQNIHGNTFTGQSVHGNTHTVQSTHANTFTGQNVHTNTFTGQNVHTNTFTGQNAHRNTHTNSLYEEDCQCVPSNFCSAFDVVRKIDLRNLLDARNKKSEILSTADSSSEILSTVDSDIADLGTETVQNNHEIEEESNLRDARLLKIADSDIGDISEDSDIADRGLDIADLKIDGEKVQPKPISTSRGRHSRVLKFDDFENASDLKTNASTVETNESNSTSSESSSNTNESSERKRREAGEEEEEGEGEEEEEEEKLEGRNAGSDRQGRQLSGYTPSQRTGCAPTHVCCRRPVYKAAAKSAPYTPTCGVRNSRGVVGRVNSGVGKAEGSTEFAEYPWQAAILRKDGDEMIYVCGASLIDSKNVLTAAHCVEGIDPRTLKIRLGEWDVSNRNEFYRHLENRVSGIYIHPDFYAGNLNNDLAVVRMAEEIDFELNPHISPVCLPSSTQSFTGRTCTATGWGKDAFGDTGKYSRTLKEVDLPVVDSGICQIQLRKTRLGETFTLHQGNLCAGGQIGKDTCKGDGGGPLVCDNPGGGMELAGIVSWGIGCGHAEVPGVYVRVSYYLDWIKAITRN